MIPKPISYTEVTLKLHPQLARRFSVDMAPNKLLRLSNFIQERLDRNVDVTDDVNCTICLESLRAGSEKCDAVVSLPCKHILHLACLLALTEGYTDTRNKCPNCREALFELNLLSPSKLAQRLKDEEAYYNPTGHFDAELYTRLVTFTDEMFNEQLHIHAPKCEEDYTRIPKAVCSKWTRLGLDKSTICKSHTIAKLVWVEMAAATRVMNKLKEADLEYSWSGRVFKSALDTMHEMFGEQFRAFNNNREIEERVVVAEEEERPQPGYDMPAAMERTMVDVSSDEEPEAASSAATLAIPPPAQPQDNRMVATRALLRRRERAQRDETFHGHFPRIRERIQQHRVIVLELYNVSSANACGDRMQRIKISSGDVSGVVSDVDGWSIVGSLAMFWRWKAQA